jgi:hypothetical protein
MDARCSSCSWDTSCSVGGCEIGVRSCMLAVARLLRISLCVAARAVRSACRAASSPCASSGTAFVAGRIVFPSSATIVVWQKLTRLSSPVIGSSCSASVRTCNEAELSVGGGGRR